MADDSAERREPKYWIIVIAIVILLVFLYFFKPFESYLVESIPNVHFSNVVFWFASLVGVVCSNRREQLIYIRRIDVGIGIFS